MNHEKLSCFFLGVMIFFVTMIFRPLSVVPVSLSAFMTAAGVSNSMLAYPIGRPLCAFFGIVARRIVPQSLKCSRSCASVVAYSTPPTWTERLFCSFLISRAAVRQSAAARQFVVSFPLIFCHSLPIALSAGAFPGVLI